MTDAAELVREILDITAPNSTRLSNFNGVMNLGHILAERGWFKRAEAALATPPAAELVKLADVRDAMLEMGPQVDPVREYLRRMLAEFGDQHYHTCPADNDSGPCDCFAGALVKDATAALAAQQDGARKAQVNALAEAMWQLLDDMGEHGQCVCLEAKARARIAFEPFRDQNAREWSDWMTMAQAQNVIIDVLRRPEQSRI